MGAGLGISDLFFAGLTALVAAAGLLLGILGLGARGAPLGALGPPLGAGGPLILGLGGAGPLATATITGLSA